MDHLASYKFDRSCPDVSENLNGWAGGNWGNYLCNVTVIKIATLLWLKVWLILLNIQQQTQTLFRRGRESYFEINQ